MQLWVDVRICGIRKGFVEVETWKYETTRFGPPLLLEAADELARRPAPARMPDEVRTAPGFPVRKAATSRGQSFPSFAGAQIRRTLVRHCAFGDAVGSSPRHRQSAQSVL